MLSNFESRKNTNTNNKKQNEYSLSKSTNLKTTVSVYHFPISSINF